MKLGLLVRGSAVSGSAGAGAAAEVLPVIGDRTMAVECDVS